MQKYYGSSMIGLDVKPRRQCRIRRNRMTRITIGRWIIPAVIVSATLWVVLMAGAR